MLSVQAQDTYRQDGYHFPIEAVSAEEARDLRARLEAFERRNGGPLKGELRHKPHLLFTWLNDLIRRPSILDAVEDVLGPNLLCWGTSFFIKEANDAGRLPREPGATGPCRPSITIRAIAGGT